MNKNIFRFLPIIIILFFVVAVLSWYAKNPKEVKKVKPETVNPSQLDSDNVVLSPTPTSSFFFQTQTETLSDEPSVVPVTTEPEDEDKTTKGGEVIPSEDEDIDTSTKIEPAYTITSTTRTCTPVYGMADSCEEHTVVDTGAESAVAYSLSAFSYLAGLVAFVKSKKA
jgi:hypothetical protein